MPLKTASLTPGGGSPTLPKATVQLPQPTQALTSLGGTASSPESASFRIAPELKKQPIPVAQKIVAGLGLAAAIALLVTQVGVANVWIKASDNARTISWFEQVTQSFPNAY